MPPTDFMVLCSGYTLPYTSLYFFPPSMKIHAISQYTITPLHLDSSLPMQPLGHRSLPKIHCGHPVPTATSSYVRISNNVQRQCSNGRTKTVLCESYDEKDKNNLSPTIYSQYRTEQSTSMNCHHFMLHTYKNSVTILHQNY